MQIKRNTGADSAYFCDAGKSPRREVMEGDGQMEKETHSARCCLNLHWWSLVLNLDNKIITAECSHKLSVTTARGCVLRLFYLVIHSDFYEAQFPLSACLPDCSSYQRRPLCTYYWAYNPVINPGSRENVRTVSSEGRLTGESIQKQ